MPQGHLYVTNEPRRSHFVAAAYISAVWLLSEIGMPGGEMFHAIPLYVIFSPIMLVLFGRDAIVRSLLVAFLLYIVELVKNVQPDYHETLKAVVSLPVLAIIISTIYLSLVPLLHSPAKFIGKWLNIILYVQLCFMVLQLVLGSMGLVSSKYPNYFLPIHSYSGFFTEPSHLAVGMAPFIVMAIVDFATFRSILGKRGILAVATIYLLCSSATEFVVVITATVALMVRHTGAGRLRHTLFILLAIPIVGLAVLTIPSVYERALSVFQPSTAASLFEKNALDALVLLKGAQMAQYALHHMPLGAAFLDMAAFNRDVNVSKLSNLLYKLNADDGASLLLKGICEYGYLFLVFVIYALAKILKKLFLYDKIGSNIQKLFYIGLIVSFIPLFARASTYFSSVAALSLTLMVFPDPTAKLGQVNPFVHLNDSDAALPS